MKAKGSAPTIINIRKHANGSVDAYGIQAGARVITTCAPHNQIVRVLYQRRFPSWPRWRNRVDQSIDHSVELPHEHLYEVAHTRLRCLSSGFKPSRHLDDAVGADQDGGMVWQ